MYAATLGRQQQQQVDDSNTKVALSLTRLLLERWDRLLQVSVRQSQDD
jgi:hypothetical protein